MPAPDFSPSAERNQQPILDVLSRLLPEHGSALELASGTGQHAAWFAAGLPHWVWQPTEAQPGALETIAGRTARQRNVRPPLLLDVMAPRWLADDARFDLVFCANMLHIAPWPSCAALMRGSAGQLAPGGALVTYGPYLEGGVATSAGNLAFDRSLRDENADWGIRRREDVEMQALDAGLRLSARYAMPASNLLLVWRPVPA